MLKKKPTSGLEPLTCSLRVIHQALQRFAWDCKSRVLKPLSLLWLALCCAVLRSRWYQNGINTALASPSTRGTSSRFRILLRPAADNLGLPPPRHPSINPALSTTGSGLVGKGYSTKTSVLSSWRCWRGLRPRRWAEVSGWCELPGQQGDANFDRRAQWSRAEIIEGLPLGEFLDPEQFMNPMKAVPNGNN